MSDHSSPALADEASSGSSTTLPQKSNSQRSLVLMIGGVGCVLFLCIGVLAGSGFLFFISSRTDTASAGNETIAEEIELPQLDVFAESPTEDESGAKITETEIDSTSTGPAPEMSAITFALETTANGEPVESSFTFEAGITQLHAVFDYTNLTPNHTWTQVWYHNGNEVSSTSQPWPEGEAGSYDYLIEAGGDPLPVGDWALEFYIDDELLTAGSFVIEGQEETLETGELPDPANLPKVYKLVYPKWNGEKHDLYVGDTNGSQEQFIMGRAAGPSWSRDGQYIFFYGEEGVDQQVVNGTVYPLPGATNGIVRLDASPLPAGVRQLQLYQGHGWNDGTARGANISPDGAMIAYDGDRGGGRRIYFLGTAANQQFRYEIIGEQADWSPDSQKIVYRSGRNNQFGIWISNRNDSGHLRITSGGTDSFPTWSPDGQTIAFSRDAGGNVDIYTVNVDGTNLQRLTDAPGHDTLPLYLPNGDLVFRSTRSGRWSIWKMKGDGSEQVEIISNAPVGPEWSFSKMAVLR
jgi:hypothetical protein